MAHVLKFIYTIFLLAQIIIILIEYWDVHRAATFFFYHIYLIIYVILIILLDTGPNCSCQTKLLDTA